MEFRIDIKDLEAHAKRLHQVSKNAFPRAIRETLSKVALDVKKNTMPKSAKETFVNREKNFFKANSTVEFAKGNDVNNMASKVGFAPTKVKHNQAVEDLEQQEHGGKIDGRSFIAKKGARVGSSKNKKVRPINRLESVKNVINAENVRFKGSKRHRGQRFIRAAFMAKKLYGSQALVMGNKGKYKTQTLSKIDSIETAKERGGKVRMKRTALYSYKKGRFVSVVGTSFMKRASLESALKADEFFYRNAAKEYDRLKK